MSTETTSAIQRASEIAGGKAALARLVGVKPPTVQQWASGARPVAIERCVAIEQATKGAVTRKALRPNDWHLIWPELAADNDVIKASDDVQPPVGTSVRKKR
ncbi:helix-turn-helix domain-containing protein [Cupriavidus sp. CV2]|uniref:transcriptional regulator n=1 Tax=Cupriavidus TaxID=106589 RepID=UPI00296B404F|nr:helix-turn-helix domain-containing protein [Cupriavidus sp. CV2]MDW3682964.1 helix-turn-helix domain-containing protein [Cupriavidus sp. CV2]